MESLISRQNLDFLLYDWLNAEDLVKRARFADHSRATFDACVDLCAQLAAEKFAPHNRASDLAEPYIEDGEVVTLPAVEQALRAFAEAGLVGSSMSEEVGGFQLPHLLSTACSSFFQAANSATFAYAFLTIANANLLARYGTAEQIAEWVVPMVQGRFFGTMCLSEPEVGSSLADIETIARDNVDGTYRLFGSKMWISAGEHQISDNIVHLVLARTAGAPAGVYGLSLFIVPKFVRADDGSYTVPNDVALVGLNHKMGYRGTTNTVLAFGDRLHTIDGAPGAVGYLVGDVGAGLTYMFHMMNEARIVVGSSASALGSTAYLKSLRYARERRQGRASGTKDPALPPVAIIEHPDVLQMLLAQKSYVEGAMALVLYCARLTDEQQTAESDEGRAASRMLLDLLTPVAKSWPAQWCLRANDLAIQIHGGYGYARDCDVEQHYRDNRLNMIHEGTHGIQGLDLLGRKVTMQGGRAFESLTARIATTVSKAQVASESYALLADRLDRAVGRLLGVTAFITQPEHMGRALAHASTYLEAFGHVVVAWLWLDQLVALGVPDSTFAAGKVSAAQFFFRYELPKVDQMLDLLESLDTLTLDTDEAWL